MSASLCFCLVSAQTRAHTLSLLLLLLVLLLKSSMMMRGTERDGRLLDALRPCILYWHRPRLVWPLALICGGRLGVRLGLGLLHSRQTSSGGMPRSAGIAWCCQGVVRIFGCGLAREFPRNNASEVYRREG